MNLAIFTAVRLGRASVILATEATAPHFGGGSFSSSAQKSSLPPVVE
jgi:hypothetical protein